jgi:hypothetical protein
MEEGLLRLKRMIVDFRLPIERLERPTDCNASEEPKARTKTFALRVIKLVVAMPGSLAAQVIGKQLDSSDSREHL